MDNLQVKVKTLIQVTDTREVSTDFTNLLLPCLAMRKLPSQEPFRNGMKNEPSTNSGH